MCPTVALVERRGGWLRHWVRAIRAAFEPMVAPQMVRSPVLEDFRKRFQVAMRRSGRALRVVREGFRSRGEIDRESVLKDVRPGLQCRCCLMLGVVSMPLDRGGSWVEPIVSCSEVQRIALIGPVFQRSCSAERRRSLS